MAVLVLGDTHVGNCGDRTDNALEAPQQELLEAVCATGTPTVVVMIAGYGIYLGYAKAHCDAILFAFLPSQSGGQAIADTVLGLSAPAGRLLVTFYSRDILRERPDSAELDLRAGSGITCAWPPPCFSLPLPAWEGVWVPHCVLDHIDVACVSVGKSVHACVCVCVCVCGPALPANLAGTYTIEARRNLSLVTA